MIFFIKKILAFILNHLAMFLFPFCFFWILYILFVGYAPWSEKIIHLIIAGIILYILGRISDWYYKDK
ncbi:hypothetical protein QT13_19200 [Pectobacterium brasiliense]|nr:hypothetical protein CTV95_20295 [Pectobacterium brasiliense]KAA3667204.1 hypothetical protein FEV48_11855 [Pectobacterium carotovorum subsp. carotovorum]KFX10312.1 hypothetical protein KP17_19230 [Pectobacterium parvum]KHS64155.1 hypothetical protein QT13_19200 [Pectobacterium brasiliense]KHT02551.1 hypothetical protein RC92_19450 [Pectobacterium brasiliense]